MKSWPLRTKIIFVALFPASVTALVLLGQLFLNHYTMIEQNQIKIAESLARQLAIPLAEAIERDDRQQIKRVMDSLAKEADIRAISVHNKDRENVFHQGPSMYPVINASHRLQLKPLVRYSNNTLRIIQPLLSPALSQNNATHLAEATVTQLASVPQFVHMEVKSNVASGWLEIEIHLSQTRLSVLFDVMLNLALIAILLIGALFLAFHFSRQFLESIQEARKTIQLVSSGNYTAEAKSVGCPEFHRLADDINQLTRGIKLKQQELSDHIEQSAIELDETITTMETQSIELDLARKRAEEANRIKSEFLANMSHEIRTPMNGIVGFCNLLSRTSLTPHQSAHLNSIRSASESLLSIINDILDFSKIEAQKMEIKALPFDLRETLDETIALLAPEVQRKQLEMITLVYDDVPTTLIGDALRIRQVLTNLLGNAIKFTDSGDIVIRVMTEQETHNDLVICFKITDNGIGIAKETQQALFTPFTQADSSQNRQHGGTGLGLVICKRLVELMGGEVGLESEPDQGSTFWFTIRTPVQNHHFETEQVTHFNRLRTLLVESHALNQNALAHQLTQFGLNVTSHNSLNGTDVQTPSYDLAVLAFNHHEAMDRAIQALTYKLAESVPVLVLLGSSDSELISRYQRAGVNHVGTKPIGLEELKTAIRNTLNNHGYSSQIMATSAPFNIHQSQASSIGKSALTSPSPSFVKQDNLTTIDFRPSAPSILIVDDNASNLLLASTLLQEFGLNVTQANSGKKAIEEVLRKRPDLILMDIQMPDMDGMETTRRIRNLSPYYEDLGIIALTAHALPEERESFMAAGLNDLLTKPIDEEKLAKLIQHWTGFTPSLLYPVNNELRNTSSNVDDEGQESVVDMELGIRLAGGKIALAEEMIHMLLEDIPQSRQRLKKAFSGSDVEEMISAVHHLHGATRYCGVPRLALTTETLETQLKMRQLEPAQDTLETLYDELDKLEQWGKQPDNQRKSQV